MTVRPVVSNIRFDVSKIVESDELSIATHGVYSYRYIMFPKAELDLLIKLLETAKDIFDNE